MKIKSKTISEKKDPAAGKRSAGPKGRPELPDKSETLYHSRLESHPDAILIYNCEVFLYANPAALDLLGYTSVKEMTKAWPWKFLHPDDKALFTANILKSGRKEAMTQPIAYRICREDGSTSSVQVLAGPVMFKGEQASQAIFSDVTDYIMQNEILLKDEQEMNTLFEILPLGVSVIDSQRNIIKYNNRLKEIMTFPDKENPSFKHLERQLIHEDGTPLLHSEIPSVRAMKEGLVVNDAIIGVVEEDGTIAWASVSAAPLPDSKALVVTMDITERKNEQREFQKRISKIEEVERRRFAADLHDDLGPTLSAMNLQTDLILKIKDPSRIGKHIDILKDLLREVNKKVHVISHNLIPHLLEDFGLEAAVKDLVQNEILAKSFAITLKSNLGSKRFPDDVENHFYRIISELVNNSIKHSGGDRIIIRLDHCSDIFQLIYSDNGKGFSFPKISSTSKGIGLSNIIYRVNLMNAVIDWKCTEGKCGVTIRKRITPETAER
jgi:PAS domain S-box-containing protein